MLGAITVLWTTLLLAPQTRTFEQNPVTHPQAEVFEFAEFDAGADHLLGPYFESVNCVASSADQMCEPSATVSPDDDGNFFVDLPDIDDPADAMALEDAYAEVAAYFHADRFYAHLFAFDVPPPLCFDDGLPLTLVVNVRGPADESGTPGWFEGAFYSRDCERGIVLGQAEGADLAYDGDLVYHEVAHAAIDALSGEDIFLDGARALPHAVTTDPSALNEGLADFLSAAFTGDPVLGEYIEEYAGLGRRLDHDLGCPQTLVGQRHLDGRAWAAALYDIWERHGDPFYAAVLDTAAALPADADFAEASAILQDMTSSRIDAATALEVEATLSARGLLDCRRVLAPTEASELHLIPDPQFDPFRPAPVQFELPTVTEPSLVSLRYTGTQFGENWTIEALVGRDEPIVFSYEDGAQTTLVSHSSDEFLDGSEGTIVVAVDPGESVYLSLFNAGADLVVLRDFEVDIEATESTDDSDTDSAAGTEGDADTDANDSPDDGALDDDGGCGCRATPSRRDGLGALLLLGLLSVRRSRTRAGSPYL